MTAFIEAALANGSGRKLIIAQDARVGFFAILDFADLGERIGECGSTPDDALAFLELKLMEDSALEIMNGGSV